MHLHRHLLAAAPLFAALQLAAAAKTPKNAILLSEVQSLTLRANKPTTHRRVSAIPQLRCVSPKKMCALHTVDVMRCVNQGAGYSSEDVQWACSANLPATLQLGSTDVLCEGYASSGDPYVLRGSCGVEYRLVLTEAGERAHPELAGKGAGGSSWFGGGGGGGDDVDWSGYLFAIVFFAVVAWMIWSACANVQANQRRPGPRRPRNNNFWGGGGGGGGGGPGFGGGGGGADPWDDPPPPYPGSKPRGSGEGWRPGFWSGVLGGAAAGYMAGNRGNQAPPPQRNTGWGWGSGTGNGAGPSRPAARYSSDSQTRHESTGFGSTSRR